MKFNRTFICAFASVALLASCSEEPGVSTKVPVNPETPEVPDEEPDEPGSEVVSPVPSFTCSTQKATINASKVYQKMEGFGASDCWLPAKVGKYWTGNRREIATRLFSQTISKGKPQGIGLSMWRVNLGAGTEELGDAGGVKNANNRAESYLNGSIFDWNKCAGQRYFMEQAKINGCESFVFFSNSPLCQYTLNGQGRSDAGDKANLKDDCYDDFALYLANVADHFVKDGYNVTHISPLNEPQYNWEGTEQEGSGWQNSEIARLTRELDKALTDKGLATKILIPEAGAWDCLYQGDIKQRNNQTKAFFDAESEYYVGDCPRVDKVVGAHSYWSCGSWNDMRNVRTKVANNANSYGVRVWQTEWSMLGGEPSDLGGTYDQVSEFDIAQYMSRVIHNDITVAGCSSWSYWTAISVERYSQKNRFELIKTTPSGGNYSDDFTSGGNVTVTPNLWVLGNYSLFVRPGYKRIDLNTTENKDFFGSAYISPDGKTIVAVYTNYDKTRGVTLNNTFASGETPVSVKRYTTTKSKELLEEAFNPADKVFLDPASVTTIVYTFE